MNNVLIVLTAALIVLIGPAVAGDFDRAERDAWKATALDQPFELAPVVVEGRNAALVGPVAGPVEPYIAQSIEQNARSSR